VPTTRIPGLVLTDHMVELPLDHAAPDDGRTIEVFAREVVAPGSTIHTDGAQGQPQASHDHATRRRHRPLSCADRRRSADEFRQVDP
jgi:hypothetical protein